MRKLKFSKMQGLGNDFIVIDAISQSVELSAQQIRWLADRHFGIGCDQLLLVETPQSSQANFHYRIFNADGSEVAQCGNGIRCFARFVMDKGLTDKKTICVETASGLIYPAVQTDGSVTVDMGKPEFVPERIPFIAEQSAASYVLELAKNDLVEINTVSIGNPHAVTLVEDIDAAPVEKIGPLIEQHPRFPKQVNVGFMQIISPSEINLRVYERGAGETLACGTGACAAVVTGIRQDLLVKQVKVNLPGGSLMINWDGGEASVLMTGPAEQVFDGEIEWAKINQ